MNTRDKRILNFQTTVAGLCLVALLLMILQVIPVGI